MTEVRQSSQPTARMGVRRSYGWVLAGYAGAVAVGVGAVAATMSGWFAVTAVGLAFAALGVVGAVAYRRLTGDLRVEREQLRHRQALFHTELSDLARLREAGQIREDLIASVTHEFRTPLTAIRAGAATLVQRYEQLDRDAQEDLLVGILEHSDRLTKLVEDMLVAASASVGEPGGIADVGRAMHAFALGQPRPPVVIDVDQHLAALIPEGPLGQLVEALGEHVKQQSRRDRPVAVRAWRTGDEVLISAEYALADPKRDVEALLDPFGGNQSVGGKPASLALYVVRRLVEVHGGTVLVRKDGETCCVRIALRALGHRMSPERGAPEPVPGATKAGDRTDADAEPAAAARP